MIKKYFFLFILVFLFTQPLIAGKTEKFSQIRIFIPDRTVLDQVWRTGIDFEGSSGKIGGWMEFIAGLNEIAQLKNAGISYTIIVDDLSEKYAKSLAAAPNNAFGFGYGSMGGYLTYDEVIRQLDSMKLLFPQIITDKTFLGNSYEGRSIYGVKISTDPDNEDPSKPEVLYTALHHAREPEGMMSMMYYMWWLLENYTIDPEATYLVNHRRMWFIPIVNVDGYAYNQSTNPGGGGMWRKDRSYSSPGVYGVDLNRNYGTYDMWDSPNGGSSTSPNSETYRGLSPFSELETQTIDIHMRSHNFKTCLNYHTYGNYLIYPWGYLSAENGDSLIYRDWTYDMTFANHYTNGTDQQTVNYSTRGGSDDYMFGDTSKPITYAMTPEVGTSGFWPTIPEIYPLAQQNLIQNKLLAYFAGAYPTIRHYEIDDTSGDGFIDRGENFSLVLTVRNRGLGTGHSLTFAVSSSVPTVQFTPSSVTLDSLQKQTTAQVTLSGKVASGATTGIPFKVFITTTDPQGFAKHDTLNLYLGIPTIVFSDSASGGTSQWTTGTGWDTTSVAHTPPSSFTDSPSGNYAANADNSLTTVNQIDLSGFNHAELRFWTKWAVEPTWDFASVEISTNNGSTWTTMHSSLSHSGSGRSGSKQPSSAWGYESYTPGLTWVAQTIDLNSYAGTQIKLRFRVAADGGDQRDGFSVDDIRIYGYQEVYPLTFSVNDGWNMVSIPAIVEDRTKTTLFPTASTRAFAFLGSYVPKDTLEYGEGYWVKFPGTQDVPIGGFPLSSDTLSYPSGWNLGGNPLSCATLYDLSAPENRPFIYRSGYLLTDTLPMGAGFWIKGPQTIIFNCAGGFRNSPSSKNLSVLNSLNLLTISDSKGNTATLYFGEQSTGETVASGYELPPKPPFGLFDARFSSQRLIENFSGTVNDPQERRIEIQTTSSPLKISWDIKTTSPYSYYLTDTEGKLLTSSLSSSGSFPLSDPNITSLGLRVTHQQSRPKMFSLRQNYPNPFNPSTTIGFDIAEQSVVSLKIFNILGQTVREVIQEQLYPAGIYSIKFNASDLNSGIYFYKLFVRPSNGTKSSTLVNKMMILK